MLTPLSRHDFFYRSAAATLLAICMMASIGCSSHSSSAAGSAERGAVTRQAIIGGTSVSSDQAIAKFTVLVMIYDSVKQSVKASCSGVLIADDLVLTAAHCLLDQNNQAWPDTTWVIVAFGSHVSIRTMQADHVPLRIQSLNQTRRRLDFAGSYRLSSEEKYNNDISVIHLKTPAPPGFEPISILTNTSALKSGAAITLAGFGAHAADDSDERIRGEHALREMTSTITGRSSAWLGELSVQSSPTLSPGSGDSGGPALIEVNGQTMLWGIYSNGSMADPINYEILANHVEWIRQAAHDLGSAYH